MNEIYKALVVEEIQNKYKCSIKEQNISELPAGSLLIKVYYSSLNYKDALSASGNRGVTRNYPHTPGIDAAGVVVSSDDPDFSNGDEVLVTGFDLGMNTPGGFGEYVRVPSNWALTLPDGLSMKDSMVLGTAGLTAGLSVYRLSTIVKPESGIIAVSGATGGVGSISLAILNAAGYRSAAVTRKPEQEAYLRRLGADEVILGKDIESGDERALLKARFSGGIDTVGGVILQNILKSTKPLGVVTCCGNAASDRLDMTVYPFILRGISLVGIDSQDCPVSLRGKIWKKLSNEWRTDRLINSYEEINLEELPVRIEKMLKGESKGRVIIKHDV